MYLLSMKKLSALVVITGLLLLSTIQIGLAFTDTDYHSNQEAIDYLENNGVVGGYTDGTYKPNNPINRAEFTKIVMESIYPDDSSGSYCFPDVTNKWYAKYVCRAKELGILSGYPDGFFRPSDDINMVEGLKIILEAYEFDISDTYEVWYESYYWFADSRDLLDLINKDVAHNLTRGEMAQIIYNVEVYLAEPIENPTPDPSPEPEPTPDPPVSTLPPYSNPQTDWQVFINWMAEIGYDSSLIDYYEDKHSNPDPEYAEAMNAYLELRSLAINDDSFFSIYKNSNQGDQINLKIIEVYPTEPGWILERSSEFNAANQGLSLAEYLGTTEAFFATSLGREINIEVEKKYISYDDFFFSDDLYTTESDPSTFYVNGDTFAPYAVTEEFSEYQTIGTYVPFAGRTEEQQAFFVDPVLGPNEPGAVYVFMGGITPDNYAFEALNLYTLSVGCVGLSSDSYIFCSDAGTARTSFIHEQGHVLRLPHAAVYEDTNRQLGVPTVLGSSPDWPCLVWTNEFTHRYSPLERYALEPYDGFENEENAVNNYNEHVLCD